MFAWRALCLLPVLGLTACSTPSTTSPSSGPVSALHGFVHGGQQPVARATVQLLAAGATGDGSSPTSLIYPLSETDSNGNFNITSTYNCPSPDSQTYIVATGGNPGLTNGTSNAAIALMAALGRCGDLSASTTINIDEVTTVAAVYSLAAFANSPSTVGSASSDAAILASAFALAKAYASSATGVSPGSAPAGTTVPAAEINTLADILATCINSAGGVAGDSSPCGNLFALTTPAGSTAPADTVVALFHLAQNPALNTQSVFNLAGPSAPFQPTLSAAPADFSLGLTALSGLASSATAPSFGSVTVGSTSGAQSLTLRNNSQSPISLSALSIAGLNASDFSQTGNCPSSLNAGGTCSVQITFAPSATGSRIALLAIPNSSSNNPLLLNLSGLGSAAISALPQLTSASPSSVAAGAANSTITLSGSGFLPTSLVYVAGFSSETTTYISPTSVSFSLPAQFTSSPGTVSITVRNGSYASNALSLPVVNAAPVLTSISPASVIAGAPNFSLTLNGSGFTTASTVVINAISHPISPTSGSSATVTVAASEVAAPGNLAVTVSTPAPGGGTSAAQQLSVLGADNRVRTLNYATSDVATDPVRNLVYASVGSSSGTSPNSVIAINPLQGTVQATQSVASSPGRIAVSDDGSFLYVALPSSNQVSRFTLPSLTPDITWSTPEPVEDIQVAPGQPHTVALAYANYQQGITAVYDDGVARTAVVQAPYPTSFDTVAWGSSASVLYGTSAKISGGPEYTYTVNPSGVALSSTVSGVLGDFQRQLSYEASTGRLYDGSGRAIKAADGSLVGQFFVQNTLAYEPNPFAVDTADSRVFFLNENSTVSGSSGFVEDIQAFDATHFNFINALEIAGLNGGRIVKWGTSGLAVGGGSAVYLIDGSFVSPSGNTSPVGGYAAISATLTSATPLTVPPGSPTTTVTISGTNISPAATVTWNAQTLASTWQSSTQILATIPASLLTQPVSSTLVVTNGPGTDASNGLPFEVLPALGPNTQIAAVPVSGEDMVWDASRNLLYVAVTKAAAPNGNSIASVDPSLASIKNVVYTGNQPGVLALSGDNQFLYAGFQTLATIDRFNASDFLLNLAIPLSNGGPVDSFATDIEVAPAQPRTIAVTTGIAGSSSDDGGGLVVFDDAVQRASTQPRSATDANKLTWGADATRLYGNSNGSALTLFSVNSSGLSQITRLYTGLSTGLRPHYDAATNLLYEDGGSVLNPADGSIAGFLEAGVALVPDSTLNRAFVLRQLTTGSYAVDIYDLRRETLLSSISLPGLIGYPTRMVRWGADGLAILTDGAPGLLYLLQGSGISGLSTPPAGSLALSPAIVPVGSGTTTISVTGTKFGSSSTVLVNGSARPTTIASSTQLSFQLTAADQAFATYLTVEVSNLNDGTASPSMSLEVANPVPAVSGLSSSSFAAGSAGTSITVTGAGFVPTTAIAFNGSARTTTYISSTQASVALTSSDLQTSGTFSITAANPGPGGGTSAAATVQVLNPAPAITQVSPQIISAGSAAQSVSVYGTGFVAGTVVRVGGAARPTSYSGPTGVTVSLTAADLAAPAELALVAFNPAPGGGTSGAASLVVSSGIPGAITFTPSAATQGTIAPTTVMVSGSNFEPSSLVQVNGVTRAFTYISATRLSFVLSASDQATVRTLYITVINPAPNGGTASGTLPVLAPAATPVLSSVSPTQLVQGSQQTYIYVTGSNFTAGSVIAWNGTALPTYYSSPASLTGVVGAALLTSAGSANISVSSPTANPSTSNVVGLTIINPPAPTLTSISPSSGPVYTAFTATLVGTNLTAATTLMINGIAVPATVSSSTSLSASVPANLVAPGNLSFTVNTPAPGGGTSASVAYTAYVPVSNNSMVYNPANGLFYLSVPSSAGSPYGNSVVPLDPVSGQLGAPIFVGSEPNKMALTSDGSALWVGLDGASAVRKVNLLTQTAGLQFALPAISTYATPLTATAMVAIPGQPDSVAVSAIDQYSDSTFAIYDSGVARGTPLYGKNVLALQVDGTRNELYGAAGTQYQVYSYSSSGIAAISSPTAGSIVAQSSDNLLQLVSGRMYTDFTTALNPETGALVGTFATNAGTTPAPAAVDSTLGLAFLLDNSNAYSTLPNRIQIFNLADFSAAGSAAIPVNVPSSASAFSRMMRWGSNGLAFRNSSSVVVLRSSLVRDLSGSPADVGVILSAPSAAATGSVTSYTATVSNAGSAIASEVSFTATLPATGVLVSATSSSGACSIGAIVTCDLGTLAQSAQTTVTLVVNQLSPGTAILTAQVSASQPDNNTANNAATSTLSVSGASYAAAPVLTSIAPSTILAGSSDTAITITGAGFIPGSTMQLDGAALSTNFISSSQLSAMVPAASLATLGWHAIAVATPPPGGGASASAVLSVFSAIKAGANHILYEPFSRNLLATIGSGTALGNSVAALNPYTGVFSTPAPVGSEPTSMALSDDGQILYVLDTGSDQIVRYNLTTAQTEDSFALTASTYGVSADGIAVQPGTENTIAVTQSYGSPAIEILDFNPVTHTAAARSSVTNNVLNASNPQFLNASTLLVSQNNEQFARYPVSSSGIPATPTSFLEEAYGNYKLAGGLAFTTLGAVANVTNPPGTLLGSFALGTQTGNGAYVAPDPALGQAFFLLGLSNGNYTWNAVTGLAVFNTNTFEQTAYLPLNIAAIDQASSDTAVDVVRWGQDGVAALTSAGTIYLLRGPAVVPQLLQSSTPPALSSATPSTLQRGSTNTVLTLAGSNFLPGVAVNWNGSYRTTIYVSATSVMVDIPANDLTSSGTATLTAINPGSATSTPVTVVVN